MYLVEELIENSRELMGKKVEVRGVITHNGVICKLNGYDEKVDGPSIEILQDELLKTLFGKVPAYGGGRYLYHDNARVIGTLARSQEGNIVIEGVSDLTVEFEGKEIKVI